MTRDWSDVAKTLDNKRLHKQALEGWQIMLVLLELDPDGNHREPRGWVNHPAVKMWRGSEHELLMYVLSMVTEWRHRGYKSTLNEKALHTFARGVAIGKTSSKNPVPKWMRDPVKFEAIASSHRKALLAKNYEWYSQFGWAEDTGSAPASYEYIWETND
jgi:hypothetical protein